MALHHRWTALPAALGVAAVLVATSRYGPGLSPDSANYLSAAEGLASGQGFLGVAGEPLAHFPPLFPTILALLTLIGIDAGTAVRLLHAAFLAAVVVAAGTLVLRATGAATAAVLAGAFVATSTPLLDAFTYAWSEATFVALTAGFALLVARFAAADTDTGVVALALVAALLILTRYAGVVIVPIGAGVIAALSSGSALRRRLRVGGFCVLASLPLLSWLGRNLLLTGTLTGERSAAGRSLVSVLRGFVASAADWIVPWEWLMRLRAYSDAPWALLLFFLAAALSVAWLTRRLAGWWMAADTERVGRAIVGFSGAWIGVYSVFLCASATVVSFNPVEPRFLVPLILPAVVLVTTAAAAALRGVRHQPTSRWLAIVLTGLLAGLLGLQMARAAVLVAEKHGEGAGGFATRAWQESPIVALVSAEAPPPETLTNGADVLFLVTGRRYSWVPRANDSSAIGRASARGEAIVVVWFDAIDWRDYLISRDALLARAAFDVVRDAADGAVYASR